MKHFFIISFLLVTIIVCGQQNEKQSQQEINQQTSK